MSSAEERGKIGSSFPPPPSFLPRERKEEKRKGREG